MDAIQSNDSQLPELLSCAFSESAIERQIETICREFGIERVTLVLGAPHLLAELRSSELPDRIAAIIICTRRPQTKPVADGVRRGWMDLDSGSCRLPRRLAADAVLLGTPDHLPVRLGLALAAAGVRRLVQPRNAGFSTTTLAGALAKGGARSAGMRTLALIDRLEARAGAHGAPFAGLLCPPLRLARRGLDRLRPLQSFRALTDQELSRLSDAIPTTSPVQGRIVMFNSALAWGGAERQLVNTLRGLTQRGHHASLVCEHLGAVPDSDFFAPELARAGVPFESLASAALAAELELDPDLRATMQARLAALPAPFGTMLWRYLAVLLAKRPAVVHAWQDQTNILAGTAALVAGIPRVVLATRNVSPRHFSYHQPHMRESYRLLGTRAGVRMLNNSAAGARDYAEWLDIPREQIAVLPNGFDPPASDMRETGSELRTRLGIPNEAPLIGSVFRFYPEKDPLLWLETAARIAQRHPEARFLLVGTGPLESEARRVAQRSELAGRVIMPGTMADPRPVLAALDVFMLTSRFEGLPNVLIEAQHAGVPVVSTNAGGSAETFIDGRTGHLVALRDPSELAAAVCRIIGDEHWASQARREAKEQARGRFGIERMIDETLALYETA